MNKYFFSALVPICLLFSSPLLWAKDIQYVSDDLTIPMRSGTTTSHKILKFLNSGQALEIAEYNEDKTYARVLLVDDESKTGWVESKRLMPDKSAREKLMAANKTVQSLKDRQRQLNQSLQDIKNHEKLLLTTQAALEDKVKKLQNTLDRLRKSASKPIRLAGENEQLKQELARVQLKNESLNQENVILGDQNIKQWFMIGAGVSIGSLILGLLITRISWGKKDRWA